jgi:hypothetical protein
MSDLKIALAGSVFGAEQTTTQIPIALGASGAFSVANNIATITFTSAHGLTFQPAAGVMPNFFGTFSGASGQTGIGTLNGPIFRILAIPSTTTIVIYTTVTAATLTSASFIPVFIPNFLVNVQSTFAGGPSQTGATTQGQTVQSANVNLTLGANCVAQYNPDNTSLIYDSTTGNTPATAPVFRTNLAASSGGQIWFDGAGGTAIFASGSAGTSRASVIL